MWHLRGGFEGLQEMGLSRSSIYRRVSSFRKATGIHPDEYVFPGISLDLKAYHVACRISARVRVEERFERVGNTENSGTGRREGQRGGPSSI